MRVAFGLFLAIMLVPAGAASGKGQVLSSELGPRKIPGFQQSSSCHSDDPGRLCLALDYVSYLDSSNRETVSFQQALANLQAINQIWSQCNIAFEIEQYRTVDPARYRLPYGGGSQGMTSAIREAFSDERSLLVVTTGPWPGTRKNAWTSMPGDSPFGVVLDGAVGNYAQIIAHELGHYLGLYHIVDEPAEDAGNLMNYKIYPTSNQVSFEQCRTARQTAQQGWKRMLR